MKLSKTKKFALTIISTLTALAGAALATGTFAWFTAANTVTVSNMYIKAEAEQGIVVANEAHTTDDTWTTSTTASHSGSTISFVPTSTATTATWYHGFSSSAADGQAYEDIAVITPVDNIPAADPAPAYGTADDGVYGFLDGTSWKNVYLLNSFFIQSSSVNALAHQDVYVRDFVAKVDGSDPDQELSKSLRVAVVKHGETTPIIVAPVDGADASNEIGLVGSKTTVTATTTTNVNTLEVDSDVTIPSYTTNGSNALQYDVFIYFEGEDEACKSNNIEAVSESLNVQFKFGNKAHD